MFRLYLFSVLFTICGIAYAELTVAPSNQFPSEVARKMSDWPMYGHDLQRSFSNPTSGLNPGNINRLKPAWFFPSNDLFSAQAVVSDGVVYIGGWDGYFYALDQRTGALRWRFILDCQNSIVPVPPRCVPPGQTPPTGRETTDGGLVTSSAAVVDGTVYFGGGRTLYALNARTGSLRWKRIICGNPEDLNCANDDNDQLRIFSSPAVYRGKVYIGVSADMQVGYRGAFLAFDADTGAQRWRFEIDPKLDPQGNPLLNRQGLPAVGLNRGCGNVWSSASIDTDHNIVAFGTSDCNFGSDRPYHSAVLALDSESGRLRWAFAPHANDTAACDFDFGATANVLRIAGKTYFGIGGKDGTYYALDVLTKNTYGTVLWSANVVPGGSAGGFYGGAAYDGKHIYSTTGFGDFYGCSSPFQDPSIHAFNVGNGSVAWEGQFSQSFAATTVGMGVVFTTFPGDPSGLPPTMNIYDAAKGTQLANIPLPASSFAPVTPVAGMVLVPMGNYPDGSSGGLAAYSLD